MTEYHQSADEDVESSSFLPKDGTAEDGGFLSMRRERWAPRRLITNILPYVAIIFLSFALGRYSSVPKTSDENALPAKSMIGQIPSEITIFKPDPSYNDDPFGPDALQSPWHNLAPVGKGHIRVDNPSSWNISGGYPLNDTSHPAAEEYTLSVFHQLHCLAAIKSKMSRLQDWYKGENDKEYLRFALGEEHIRDDHIYHCFDYIRQSLMCAGDTALERARIVNGKVVRGVDGWGVEHQCRDWDVIFKWAGEHRSGDLRGID